MEQGVLYVVATPLGNLGDLSPRAQETLAQVALIAAEDTRHSARLLRHFGIKTPLIALHEHNERERSAELIARLKAGDALALISDAGTPLISDPGYTLVRAAHAERLRVCPIPGPCALIAALSASGLPSDRFAFEGFLPARATARRAHLTTLQHETRTLIFYEAPHRLQDSLSDMCAVFGAERQAVLARELTKIFETVRNDSLQGLCDFVHADPQQQKGECVILVQGAPAPLALEHTIALDSETLLRALLTELPVKQAVRLAAAISGVKKNDLYDLALRLK
ncbi:MAG: 16S rRNA (cytidine(1402)-2'-O)-methyltransferase [Gammaproteobacteria bacterium]|nr:16S rRNA (cytidine(1402)-2'-O)-methyltransferase [Gammaproteobacteria bacterium]